MRYAATALVALLIPAGGTAVAQHPVLTPGSWVAGGDYTPPPLLTDRPTTAEVLLAQGATGLMAPGGGPAPAPGGGADAGGADAGGDDNGTNPAQNATTFIASNEYYTLSGGNRINTTYARFKYPWFEKRGALLLEIPFVYYNFQATLPGLPQIGGLGDIRIQGSYNTWTSENKQLTLINFFEVFLPTADNAIVARSTLGTGNDLTAFNLGTGKYVFGPGLGLVYAIRPNFIFAPLYFYEASVFGNPNRPDIRRGKWRVFAMYAWESGVYTLPELQILTNYLTGNNDIYFAPEFGYSRKGTTAYLKPGVGIAPDTSDRQWGAEFGFRVMY